MEKLSIPTEHKEAVAGIYEKVRCTVHMNKQHSRFFSNDIGVKQGCPLSPTLFGLCIDELDEMIQRYAANKGIDSPKIAQVTILLLMYADDVVILSRTEDEANQMMIQLQNLCELSGLTVNIDKTKAMLNKMRGRVEKIQPRITYQGKPIKVVDSFKYLGIEIPSDHRWYKCATKRKENGKRSYYAFENMCRQVDIQS
jgi:hypothetical protein